MPSEKAVLERLRRICLALPEAVETTTFGHPTFQAGAKRTFAVLDDHECDGYLCIVFKASLAQQQELLEDTRFLPSKFGARKGWTAMKVEPGLDWQLVDRLVTASYRLVAVKRMLLALDR
jgi:predicted DNA-binding protein (MmcQ/YjbR family)